MPPETVLNVNQKKFAVYMARFGKVSLAARAAGVPYSTAVRWSSLPEIKQAIDEQVDEMLEEEMSLRRELGPVYVLNKLRDLVEGEEIENSVRLGAIKLLGAENGMFAAKEEQSSRDVPVKVFLGVDPTKAGLSVEKTESSPVEPEKQPEEPHEEQTILPIVPVKKFILSEGKQQ